MASTSDLQATQEVLVVACHTDSEHAALYSDRPLPAVASNQGVLHFCPLAKYAIAFPRMSRSIVTRARSARKRLISICSAVTAERLSAPFRVPARCALTQLNNVCSTRPNVRDAAAILWPDSTSRTASCLNSSVYGARVAFIIIFPFADSQLRDTFRGGKIINAIRAESKRSDIQQFVDTRAPCNYNRHCDKFLLKARTIYANCEKGCPRPIFFCCIDEKDFVRSGTLCMIPSVN